MSEPAKSNDIRDVLLDAAGMSLDKLPMLQVIFERLATLYADSLRQYAAAESFFTLGNVESGRIGDILQPYDGNGVAGLFHVPNWDTHVIVGFDRAFVFSVVEAMFGADGSEPPLNDERAFSAIETRIAQTLLEQAGRALQAAFAPVSDTPFRFERVETRMDFAAAGRRNDRAVAAKFLLQSENRGGGMFVTVPQSALTPLRQLLARVVPADSTASDPSWASQINKEVRKTAVPLRAVLEERMVTLGDAARFRVGQVIELEATPNGRVKLEGNEQPLFWCELGQSEGVYNLRIEDVFDPEQEFISDILGR